MSDQDLESSPLEGIAVVGMSGRFPGADDLAELWRNLCGGVEGITFYSREELAAAGVETALLDDPRYVRAGAALRDVQGFDAGFFGFSPREAELMDPQHRVFLECCWEALENAGYDTAAYPGSIGIFAGMGMNGYLIHNLLSHRDLIRSTGALQVRVLNDNNFLTAMAAFKLDLRGPSVTVQSACSTSLVAVCMASQSLLQFQCDMVLAGGVSVAVPHARGYLAQESVMSPDGHCRAFDAGARGTVEGSGAGVVVLKRLADAVAEGDTIHAVIRGFATNNDGGFKLSFTAPSQDGQLEAVAMAQAMAGVPAESITYVEAHGTGTPLGDPVEVAALTEVFAASTERRGFCGLGSIKTNIGHLDAAAGVAGLIKAILAVEHGVLPPSLHFETPNPRIDFARSPFYVNTECRPWRPEGWPRRAGVSAFAIGGVNAHVVLEEPPAPQPSAAAPPWQLLVLSARTETALDAVTDRLLGYLRAETDAAEISDIAYTLQVGRRAFRHRRTLVCRDLADAAGVLERRDPRRLLTGAAAAGEPQVAFLFPGLGTEYVGMARGLYRDDAGFRARIDDCAARLAPLLDLDLREVLFPEGMEEDEGTAEPGIDLRGLLGRAPRSSPLLRTAVSQPAIFAVEYALACRLLDWGIRPQAMVGFSIGEYVAACLSGVLSLDDALRLVAGRARLIDELPAGAMLAVPLSEEAVAPWLGDLSLAAVAGPELTVLAGTEEAIAAAEDRLTAAGHVCRRLQTSHAFHSALMEPVVERFLALFAAIELRPPEIPYLSNVTGDWITGEQATDPAYWAEHLRGTVRFADAVSELWREPGRILVEVGPGQTLASWALQHPAASGTADPVALPTLRHAFDRTDDLAFLLQTVGRLWLTGLRPDWPALWANQPRHRVPLPTYPFERRRYWIEPATEPAVQAAPSAVASSDATPVPVPAAVAAASAASARWHSRPNLHVPYAPPRDATERRLVEILGELLRVDTVGLHDSFFDLGGDSLLATHLVARLSQELGAELTLRSIFESPTAAELAVAIAAHQDKGAGAWGPVVRRTGTEPPPLSFAQQRLWFLDQLDPGNPAYNVPAAVLLTGPLDRSVLAASLEEVVARHEALRTTFGAAGEEEEPVQRIAPPAPLPLPGIDLEGLPADAREAEALRLAAAEALRPFDLARGPLLRAALLRLDAERHVALFTLHHMVGDGWSADLLVRELAALYPALAEGRPSPLPPLPVQYADFVLWQRESLRGAELESQLAFWRGALAGAPAVLDLPADRPRPARASGRGGAVAAALSAEHVEALKAVGRRVGATPFMTLLAAFYALLYRLTGETDLVVGTPVANRRRPELEGLIGFFANTLVLRLALRAGLPAGEPTFAVLLAAVREAALSAYAHQDLPFERLVEELTPERSLAHSPLFQVMFLLHATPVEERELSGLTLAPFGSLAAAERAAKFDLTLELVESGPGLTALLEFRRDLFDTTTAARLLSHFAVLAAALAAVSEGADGCLAELPLLTEGGRHQLLAEWNDTQAPFFPEATLLHQLFEAQAAAQPEAQALVCGAETLTYGALDARAGRLAVHLRSLGVGPEVPVAVCAGRSADLVVALLAVLKAGGAYLPLDPGYPPERLAFLLADAGAAVLVTQSELAGRCGSFGGVVVELDRIDPADRTDRSALPLPPPLPGSLAYLIYTSGSTGRPKAVAIQHGAAVALVRWAAEAFTAAELDGVLASTSICFDLSVFELFVPLSLGGRVILAENALELPLLAAAGEVRMINTVPSAMGELVRLGAIPPSVRTVGLAGEPLQRDLVQRIYATAPGVERVLNLYGPSETTTYSTWEAMDPEGRGDAAPPAIGRPITGTRAHVLDGALAPVPIGVPGELFLSGAGLARGYLGRPALTAERWLPDPFAVAAGGRLYRTGDRVRRRPDGRLDLLGRADTQVKIRGFRIEPGEIEAALTALPAVAQAAVVAGDEGGDRRLVAWVVARQAESLSVATLRTALRERLPDFMIPAVFAFVEELPRTANGKVDRGALMRRPADAPAAPDGIDSADGPLSPLEQGVAAIFAEVLGRERVGRGESFFDLGGHSLLATRVMSRLRAAFGVELPMRRLFEAPTVASLAAAVAGAAFGDAPAAPPLVAVMSVARSSGMPLSFAQQRLWFIDQLEPGSPLYNISMKVELRGRLDPGTLAAALGEVVRRHEGLRTRFVAGTDGPVQVADAALPALALADLSALPGPASRREEARLTGEEVLRPFDLARGPLLRMLLLRRGEDDQVLVLSMHHIVSDGWSLGVLVREIGAIYPAFLAGRPSPLPELAIQYADFAVWQRRYLSGERLEAELAWWRGQLAGMPPALELPADRPRPAAASVRGAVHGFTVGEETLAGLVRLSRQHGATLFMTLLAGFAALLHRVAGDGERDELVVGTPIAGRTRVESEPLIGFFVNTLVLRVDLAGDPDPVTLLSRVRGTTLAAYAHQELPFERLVEELVTERDRSRAPLVQVMLALQNAAAGPLELPGLELTAVALPSGTAKLDLTVALGETAQGLVGEMEYSRDLFDRATIERLAGRFVRLLAGIVAAPLRPLSELPLLSAAEHQQAFVEWNATATAYPREACLQELFAAVALAMPDAPAIVSPSGAWTYGRLDAASNRLARRLRSLGVGLQTPVCLAMERSPELIVGILAILKAGGLYVPLDASYPDERLAFMLADVGAGIVLVHAESRERLAGQARLVAVDDEDDEDEEDREAEAGGPPSLCVPAESPAYVIYTSGSTGRPKGVAVPHRAVIRLVRLVRETDYVRLGPGDRIGQVANISFDAATWEVWGALLNGAAVVVIPRDVVLSPAAFAAALREQEVTALFLTTALFHRMAREVPDAFQGVRHLLFGGEAADPSAARAVLASRPPRRLLHVYGPTESTTFASWHLLRAVAAEAVSLPIGAPLANTSLYVLDRRLAAAPPGTPGELWIGGDGLAWGYWNRPELTAERFVPDPWAAGGRLYRTGDLVRRPVDGALEFLGRIDQQVKIRGFRIEPGEIEAALLSHPQVKSAVVLPRQDAGGGLVLAAYVAAAEEAAPGLSELWQWLLERLPAFMLPAAWVLLPSLPLTANGKVDRKALAKLRPERVATAGAGAAPRTPTEELVAGIFAEVLKLERVELEDDFFVLGGHSLLATQLTSRVLSVLGVELPVRTVFETPTAASLAAWIDERSSVSARAPLVRVSRGEPLVLSFAQQRLWFLDQMEPGSPLYNIPLAVELRGRLNPGVLAAVLGELVRRHETLRTRFAAGPVQVIDAAAPVALAVADLSGLPRAESRREEARLTSAEALRPFDLARGPLLRTLLLDRGEGDQVLVLSMHHIVSDGWSMGVLIREVGALYTTFLEGRPSPLPELAIQYADFAAWQRRYLAGDLLEQQLAWWREQLAGMPPVLELPADHPRPAVLSARGGAHSFAVDGETRAGLARLSRRHGATLFMTLLAGFAALLRRVAGEGSGDELAVGTPIAGRTRVEIEPLIGFFVNTLVLRADLSGDPDLVTLLGRVRETTLAAYAHQDLPFERLVEEIAPERDRSRAPLVQVVFALQNAVAGPVELPGLELRAASLPSGTAKFDLTLVLRETAEGLAGDVEYSRDLFDGATIERLAGRFERLLAGIVAAPRGPLSELPLLSAAERQQALVEWNDTAAAYPREACLPELFAAVARAMPDAPAIVVPAVGEKPAEVWTYGRLDAASNRLARHLQFQGVGPQTPVCLAMERSPELIVGILAILKAGGMYVPLDAGYPDERLVFMLLDAGATVVLLHAETRARLAGWVGLITMVAVDEGDWEREEDGPLGVLIPAESPAYVIYTSGSTGQPKGVAVPHQAIVRLVRETHFVRLGPGDRVGQVASISFDAATWEIWGALLNGATVVVIPRDVALSPPDLAAMLREQEVTSLFLTTALFTRMAREVPDAFAGVRDLLFGGEAADPSAARAVLESRASRPPRRLLHVYGPTESTTFASWHLLREVPPGATSLPIGAPLSNTALYVLDRRLAVSPPGTPGELWIGGDGLAWGYWNRPELTAERFVPDPWVAGGRLYRTGDLVRRPAGGALDFLGRIDQQVKIRGFRIEPGEVEAVLLSRRQVRSAVVLPREDAKGGLGLVAYVVAAAEEGAPGPPELRQWLLERLPAFMLPASWVLLPSLPLTANGKVDRKALAKLRPERVVSVGGNSAGVAAWTPTEELVAGIFAEVLSLEQVGLEDDFFALGGHSLLATQVASRVRSIFGLELPVRAVFEAPAVAGLARLIQGSMWGEERPSVPAPPLERAAREEPAALSFAQQRLWFLDQLEPGSPLYNVPVAVTLTGRLDRGALAAALGEVVRRHEILRTVFPAAGGRPLQLVVEPAGFAVPQIDLQGLPAGAREEEEGRLAAAEAGRPFDLGGPGSLLRAPLLRLEPERHVLLLNVHHIVSDGWSMGVLVRELGALYGAFVEGRPSPLPELAVQYADFAVWQRRRLSGALLEAELAWWRGALAGMPLVLELPADRPRPAVRGVRGAVHDFAIGGEGAAGLVRLSRRHGATLFMTLLAGFAVLLQRMTGEDDLAVGTPIAGRIRMETEPLIGLFVNTLALRVDGAGAPELANLLGRVRETTLSAYAHQEVPFERLVEELCPERDLSRPPLVQVMFSVQNAPWGPLDLPALALTASPVATGTAKFELTCTLTEREQGLAGAIEYSRDLFDSTTIERLAGRFVRLLSAAAADPLRPLPELPLLSAAERHQLLAEWNDTRAVYPLDACLHELFERQAERTPEAVAVVADDARLSFGELNARANRLARHLRRLGVAAEVPVALVLERSAALVVALLGVLKAGGAYLPVDPAYPEERQLDMLESSRAPIVLTRAARPELCSGLARSRVLLVDLDAVSEPIGEESAANPGSPVSPENLAYLLYTSGSTGRPKGTMISHSAVCNHMLWMQEALPLTAADSVLQKTPFSFDASGWEFWAPLLAGGCLVMARPGGHQDPAYLVEQIQLHRVTTLQAVPALLHLFLQEPRAAACTSLRRVYCGGEALSVELAESFATVLPAAELLNLYGPTEAAIDTSFWSARQGQVRGRVPIGRPIANARIYLLDRSLEPVPLGVPGLLCVGGEGLGRGYLGRPEMTAPAFIPDPWSGGLGRRLYLTGDLARSLPDGNVEFLGRVDRQVKVRGFRIEPGEIESVLSRHAAVQKAVVLLREDLPGGAGLAAYVVPASAASAVGPAELRDHLRQRLPAHMVPAAFVVVESLPLTPSGKVDRRKLALLDLERPAESAASAGVAPRTPAEELVAGIFAEVLKVERVGVTEDFFALGGHSLLATQVASRVRSVFGLELPVRTVFERPTVESLAAEVAAAGVEARPAAALPLARAEREGPPPLSFSQERIWFLQQLEPGSATYNMPLQVELSGSLRCGALPAALTEVVRRHESLRTAFVVAAGVPRQRISPASAFPLPLVDLSALSAADGVFAAERLGREHAGMAFDLESGPLFAALLVRLSEERHRFLLNLHHTIADGWSIQVLAQELGELYAASVEGRPGRLPELPIQYADFAVWQRRWLAETQEAELAYWESRLGGEIASAELPTDRPRPAVQTFRGGRCERVLPEDLAARLKRFGREESVTLFMTLLAATQALLSRHSGESDVAVGVPVAGRRWVETEGLIGCFLNTLVLRTDTSGQPGFRALAARVRTVTLEAYSHQTAPFEAVLARLDLHRDLSRSPLFQVLFNLLNLPAAEMSLPGLEPRALMPAEVPSKLDLTFYISEVEAGIGINLVYNADLFDAAHMEDFLAQLDLFLDQALETPEQPVTDLPLVTAAMRSVLPDPTLALDGSWIGSVYDLFAATAARAPGRTAVAHGADHAGVQTYGALLAASRCVAGWLAAQGVRRGDPVAILAVRTAPLVEAVLGVLGAGGAFVVLDAAYPALRQLEMLRLASPRAWISFASPGSEGAAPAEVLSWLREAGCACLDLPPGGAAAVEGLAPFAWEAPEVRVGPDDVACIGFTSGSTGGPKGILGLHGSLSHFLPAHCRQFDLGPDDRFSLLSGLGHDPLQREIFTPLYLGAAIAVPDPADYGISGRLAAWLCREQVTVSHLTPTLGQLLTELPPDGTRELVPSLRRVLLVGESLTRKDVARLRALAPGVSCINLYGSTETQRAVAFHPVTPEEAEAVAITERAQQVLPLGRGVQDVQLLVLTPAGGLAGLGELGEIAVRSPHLARGYLGNAELTAERFQANPFTPFPGNPPSDRIYRTGDLGRYRADGEVVFAGRLDQQVKVRGFRIELGEIEGVLAGLPGVLEAVVLLRTDLPGGAGLVAYVRTEEDRELSLRGELEARLPAYMVPASFVRLDKLPRTANGKLDRRALLRIAPELGGTSIRTLPRTPAEDLLAGIWSQVLGVDQIGVDQSFFELGGHSLLATQMASRVRDVFGVELPLRSLFLSPTLAGLTAEIERLRSGGTPERPTIASFRQDRGAPPPLSFAQERYWSGRHLEARSVASTIPMLIHLAGPLDRASLRRALAAVVDRHELLRTSFREGPEGPVQVIHPEVPVAFREVDLERLGAPERMAELRRLSALDGRMHFDYERPPLFRSTLFRGGPEEHVLLFTIHHVASDWWSTPILIREVAALYAAFCAGRPSPLPPLAAQFQDFARWQRRLSSEEEQASQVAFWREHLKGAVPVDLCNRSEGRPRPRQRSFTAGMEEIQVPQELERQLDAFSARQGVTLFMTLLAAFKALLHFETGQDDLVVPCSFANRNQLATERLIGNLATALPLRTRLSGVRTFRELLQRVRDVTLLAHDHPDIFWEPVVAGMSFLEEGDRGGLTTFRVLLQLLKVPRSAPAPPQAEIPFDVRVTPLSVDTGRMRLDLTLFLSQADRLAGRFRYNRDVLDETRVKGMRDRFLRILAAVVANPEHPLADLPFADPVPEEVERVDLALLS